MNKKLETLIIITIALIVFFLVIRLIVSIQEDTPFRNKNFCKQLYGAEDYSSDRYFGNYCVIVNYENRTIVRHYYTHEEMMAYCGRIGFFELNKWNGKCS